MAEEGGIISTTRLAEDLLDYLPENPLIEPFKDAWIHMTENYSRFTIAVLLTYAIHQVSVSKVVFPLRWFYAKFTQWVVYLMDSILAIDK